MPLHTACYCSLVDKIFGVYGPYIVQFNATTGQREAQALVRAPGEATCGIAYHAATAMLYVSVSNSMGTQYEFTAHPDVDIFPVNPASLAVGAGLGWSTIYGTGGFARKDWPNGPRMLMDFGTTDLYFTAGLGGLNNITWLGKIDPTAPALDSIQLDNVDYWSEQGCSDGTYCYFCRPFNPELDRANMALTAPSVESVAFAEAGSVMPISVEHVTLTNKQYVVCGNEFLVRIDSWGPDAYVILNLDMVTSNPRPCRLRYRSSDAKLYIPCQNIDTVIVWNPATDLAASAVAKTGFQSPIDVVFTPTKAWAVQNGPVSLMEIV